VHRAQERWDFSERRACRLVDIQRSVARYQPHPIDPGELRERLTVLAAERRRFGYGRLWVLLCREGFSVNRKRVYRLYREAGLSVRRRKRKRMASVARVPRPTPERLNQRWSMDFVSDALASGRRIRVLTVIDDFTRESLATEVDTSLPGLRVTRVLDRLVAERGLPLAAMLWQKGGCEIRSDPLATKAGLPAVAKGNRFSHTRPSRMVTEWGNQAFDTPARIV
jgi:putative transposase